MTLKIYFVLKMIDRAPFRHRPFKGFGVGFSGKLRSMIELTLLPKSMQHWGKVSGMIAQQHPSSMSIRIFNWHWHCLAGIVAGGLHHDLPFHFLNACIILLLLGWVHTCICTHSNTVLFWSHYYSVVSFSVVFTSENKNMFEITAKYSLIIIWLPQILYPILLFQY